MTRARVLSLLAALAITFGATPAARAHEVRPAYLELRQSGEETWDVLFKVPGRGSDLRLALAVELPERCAAESERRPVAAGGAFTERWRVRCAGGLEGGEVRIAGLEATMTDALARVERRDGATWVARLKPAAPGFVVAAAPRAGDVVASYLRLGVEHILGGIDHLLFVLALLLLTRGAWALVRTVTAFTLAHSLTLAAAALGFVAVPQAPVEAVIALSIAFVAAEIVRRGRGETGLAARSPWIVAFAFGLLHGFGFAGALAEIGLPHGQIPLALLCFNVGVEIGQLLFVGAALAGLALARRVRVKLPRWAEAVPAYALGAVAMYWVVQRIDGF